MFVVKHIRATTAVLTSGKEEKYVFFCPRTLNCAMRVGKPGMYSVQNPPEILLKLAPPGGYKECAVVCFI